MSFYECVTTVLCVALIVALLFWALKHEISIMRERQRFETEFKCELIERLKEIRDAVIQDQDPGAGS